MSAPAGTTTTWSVDTGRSTAGFRARGLLGLPVRGTLPLLDGSVGTAPDGTVLALSGTADAAAVATGNRKRDADLRADRLLGTTAHPRWTFVADDVTRQGDRWRVAGVLTARRACPLALEVEQVEAAADGSVRVRATGRLDRRDAGVRAPRLLVGRTVAVELDVVLHR